MDKQEPVAKFTVGEPVQRAEPRSYLFPGIVIGANLKLDGKTWLYSVECVAPGVEGMVHEFTERALEARTNRPADDCPSCHGLNISCPEGCGRDPLTGELNGTTLIRPADDGLIYELNNLPMVHKGSQFDGWLLSEPTLQAILTALRAQSDAEVEREAIVRFLRAQDRRYDNHALCLAVRIEAGEHRKDGA